MRVRRAIVVAALVVVGFAGSGDSPAIKIPAEDVGTKALILGHLETPIGRSAIIHGMKARVGPDANCFVVDTINGKKVDPQREKKMFVRCHQIRDWPDGTEATIEGREEATIKNGGNENAGRENLPPHQRMWVVLQIKKVIEPKDLKPYQEPGNAPA